MSVTTAANLAAMPKHRNPKSMDDITPYIKKQLISVVAADYTPLFTVRGISCGVAGNINLELLNDDGADVVYFAAGVTHPMVVTIVYTASTTATGIVLWG